MGEFDSQPNHIDKSIHTSTSILTVLRDAGEIIFNGQRKRIYIDPKEVTTPITLDDVCDAMSVRVDI
jgi:hypothetical protein